MFKILDLYIARTLLGTVTVTLSVLIGLSALIKFVEQLRKVGEGNYDMLAALVYVLGSGAVLSHGGVARRLDRHGITRQQQRAGDHAGRRA